MQPEFDYVLVGGGLQNALIALAILDRKPECRIVIVERTTSLGGNHTWSMHTTDAPRRSRCWLDPLVRQRWTEYEVLFPNESKVVGLGYEAIASEQLHGVVSDAMDRAKNQIIFGRSATELTETTVRLDSGEILHGRLVVDGRGPTDGYVDCGYQKFFAQEVELDRPPALTRPVVMDACVPQVDGFRFLYLLPFTQTRWLVEDTYFSDSPTLDIAAHRARVIEYLAAREWSVSHVYREEHGVLPMPWKGLDPLPEPNQPITVGYRGGWMHPATCYSLPIIIRLAQALADSEPREAFTVLSRLAKAHRSQARFSRRLNQLLFRAFAPERRWHVFARFYRLPEDVIARFFSLEMTQADKLRILCGRPPRGFSLRRFMATAWS